MSSHLNGVLDEVSDESLVKKSYSDDIALHQLFKRYDNLLYSKARNYSSTANDIEDLLQEGRIGLYKAILKYLPSLNVPFSAFAKICVVRQIISAVKKTNKQVSIEDNSFFNSNAIENNFNPENLVIDKETYAEIKKLIDISLSKFEKKVINLYLSGLCYKDIANELNKNSKAVDNALSRIKKKIAVSLKSSY